MTATANPGRAAILERIRLGLKQSESCCSPDGVEQAFMPAERLKEAPALAAEVPPGFEDTNSGNALSSRQSAPAAAAQTQPIFEPVNNPLERFLEECKSNLMECARTENADASSRQLAQVLESLPSGEIFVQDHPSLRQLVGAAQGPRAVRWSSQGAPSEGSQATISLVESLIAQTGSILVSAACGGRGASVVAPCHIAYAKLSQLLPDLDTALRNASQQEILSKNSFACVISGSSRTADIEKIMVQGAHGPRRLVVILEG